MNNKYDVSVTYNPYRTFTERDMCRAQFLPSDSEDDYNETGKVTLTGLMDGYKKRSDSILTSVLDFGCGDGRVSRFLAKECENLTCVDVSPHIIKLTQDKMVEHNNNNNVRFMLADDFDEDSVYDLICSFQVMQHNPYVEQIQIVYKIKKALKPNGWAMIHLPKLENKPDYKNMETCMCFTIDQVLELGSYFSHYEIDEVSLTNLSEDYYLWVQK